MQKGPQRQRVTPATPPTSKSPQQFPLAFVWVSAQHDATVYVGGASEGLSRRTSGTSHARAWYGFVLGGRHGDGVPRQTRPEHPLLRQRLRRRISLKPAASAICPRVRGSRSSAQSRRCAKVPNSPDFLSCTKPLRVLRSCGKVSAQAEKLPCPLPIASKREWFI